VESSNSLAQDPRFSPSYPQRVHVGERARWESVLKSWSDKITALESAGSKLDPLTHAQIQGAKDQIADAVRRLPGEVGHLYHEDQHKVEEAVHALERIFQKVGKV